MMWEKRSISVLLGQGQSHGGMRLQPKKKGDHPRAELGKNGDDFVRRLHFATLSHLPARGLGPSYFGIRTTPNQSSFAHVPGI
jgi:hypothetical protein